MTVAELGAQRAKELGLAAVNKRDIGGDMYCLNTTEFIKAYEVYRLLGEAKELYGLNHYGRDWTFDTYRASEVTPTHTALAIGLKPIHTESPERKLLREIVESTAVVAGVNLLRTDLIDQAKALLEKQE